MKIDSVKAGWDYVLSRQIIWVGADGEKLELYNQSLIDQWTD